MFIATPAPEAQPSSVGAAWVGCVAVRQGLGESGGGPGHKHAAPTGLGEPCGAVGYKHVAPTGLSGLGGARRLNPKPEGRRPKEGRKKAEARIALGIGFRYSDFGPRPSFGPRVSAFGFQSGALGHKHAAPTGLDGFGGALGYKHVAPTGLVGSCGAVGYKFLSPSEGERAGVRGMARGSNPKAESRSALGFGLRISKLKFAKEYYEYE